MYACKVIKGSPREGEEYIENIDGEGKRNKVRFWKEDRVGPRGKCWKGRTRERAMAKFLIVWACPNNLRTEQGNTYLGGGGRPSYKGGGQYTL